MVFAWCLWNVELLDFSMKKKISFILMLFLALAPSVLVAQRTKNVRGVKGVGRAASIPAAKAAAMSNAKLKALSAAGIPENVYSWGNVMITSSGTTASEARASEFASVMVDGRVRVKSEKYADIRVIGEGDLLESTVEISAEVFVDKEDPTFGIKVDGLKTFYRDGDIVTFDVTTFKDCYLRVFWLSVDANATVSGEQVFPHTTLYEDNIFKIGGVYNFPGLTDGYIKPGHKPKLQAMIESPTENEETFMIMVVALKRPVPFTESVCSFKTFAEWWYNIPADERTMKFYAVTTTR